MDKKTATGFKRVVNATVFSIRGLRAAWRNEAAFRQELVAMALLIPIAIKLGETGVQQALLILPCVFVVICELFNSAIEAVVDRVGVEHHELSGRAKDIGSAAVFVSIGAVIVVWSLVLL